jgi:endonuclease/exonuclease/phosphatase family metal-dependent hydrolase
MKQLTFLFLCWLTFSLQAQHLNVATYNLRFDNPADTPDTWVNRCPHITGLVQLYDFDIFGTQEGLHNQLEDLKKMLPGFGYIGVARDNGVTEGEYSAIFYKTGKFTLLENGNFWLSEKTDKPNIGWDAACIRICTWGKFADKVTGRTFYLFNVHFDHKGEVARRESVKLLTEKVKAIAGKASVIVMGDFNFAETNENYTFLNNTGIFKDIYTLAKFKYEPNSTFNSFGHNIQQKGRIDHIFVSPEFTVERYGILTNTYMGRYPSDHFPVLGVLSYSK